MLGALAASGCGTRSCPDEDVDLTDASPVIEEVTLLEGAVPSDPWEVVFAMRFRDGDGDLGHGFVNVYLNGNGEPTELELFDSFRQSALSLDSRSGTITLPLRFAATVQDGDHVRMGMQLLDAASHRGNCYTVELRFDVRELAAHRARAAVVLAAARCPMRSR